VSKEADNQAAAARFAALGNAARLAVVRLLVKAGHEGLTIGAIQRHLDMPASTVAHHLRFLVNGDIVTQERNGREVICRANYQSLNQLSVFLLHECCQGIDGCGD